MSYSASIISAQIRENNFTAIGKTKRYHLNHVVLLYKERGPRLFQDGSLDDTIAQWHYTPTIVGGRGTGGAWNESAHVLQSIKREC